MRNLETQLLEKIMRKLNKKTVRTTDLGTKVTTRGNNITLETPAKPKLRLVKNTGRDMSWLMDAVSSTPYATIRD